MCLFSFKPSYILFTEKLNTKIRLQNKNWIAGNMLRDLSENY